MAQYLRPFDLATRFRALSREMRARFEAARVGGKHSIEKGMRVEQVLRDFLVAHLPARYGVSRGEIAAHNGQLSHQVDIVIYDALDAPLLSHTDTSTIFPAEAVYAAIEVKRVIQRSDIDVIVENIASVKALPRSAIVREHEGHRLRSIHRENPAIFGAAFAFGGGKIKQTLVPRLHRDHSRIPRSQWTDCICILDKGLIYHFARDEESGQYGPGFINPFSILGCYESGEDSLLLFYLFLMAQLSARSLFPPRLESYAAAYHPPVADLYVPSLAAPPGVLPRPEEDDDDD
ncbi:MAG: hypothetical protein FJ291_08750 [Planctomycetes bacterium]|nr:hypothetical protein [Planctomycetota bacterium]